jgi:hypothetical protein
MEGKVPPPKEPRPKVPEKPPEKPSPFGENGYIKSGKVISELKKDKTFEYFNKRGWTLSQDERIKIGEILTRPFGGMIESTEKWKIESLTKALTQPDAYIPSDEKVKGAAKEIITKYGPYKAKIIGEYLREKFGLK